MKTHQQHTECVTTLNLAQKQKQSELQTHTLLGHCRCYNYPPAEPTLHINAGKEVEMKCTPQSLTGRGELQYPADVASN